MNYQSQKLLNFLKTLHFTEEVNNLIVNNILLYFSIYLPKYLTSYCNSGINGELNLGINDWGIITGIPMKQKIDKLVIEKQINTIVNNQVCKLTKERLSKEELKKVCSTIKIEVMKLNTQNLKKSSININKIIHNYFKKKKGNTR